MFSIQQQQYTINEVCIYKAYHQNAYERNNPRKDVLSVIIIGPSEMSKLLRGQNGGDAELPAFLQYLPQAFKALSHEVIRLVNKHDVPKLAIMPVQH